MIQSRLWQNLVRQMTPLLTTTPLIKILKDKRLVNKTQLAKFTNIVSDQYTHYTVL